MRTRFPLPAPFLFLLALLPVLSAAPSAPQGKEALSNRSAGSLPLTREQLSGMSLQDTYRTIADRALPAVASVYVEVVMDEGGDEGLGDMDDFFNFFFGNPRRGKRQPQSRERTQQAFGSGFLISDDGYLISNDHVVRNARKITVKFASGKEYPAKLVGSDADTDLALLKIEGKGFAFLPLGDSDALRVGDIVVAVGNPFGLQSTFTTGVVSAKGRNQLAEGPRFQNFIQSDVAINPGNSGGPLINIFGEVVGINSMILSRSGGSMGLSFSIPVNMAKEVIDQLKTRGSVSRGWLGVGIMDITPDKAKELDIPAKGVYVPEVYSNSPAEKAGVKPADIILEINGKEIPNIQELVNLIGHTPAGTKVTLAILRANKRIQLEATIEPRPAQQAPSIIGGRADDGKPAPTSYLGLQVQEQRGAVVVTGMDEDSPFRGYDVRRGDLVYQVDYNPIGSLADYQKYMEISKTKGKAIVIFKRGNAVSYPFVVKFRP